MNQTSTIITAMAAELGVTPEQTALALEGTQGAVKLDKYGNLTYEAVRLFEPAPEQLEGQTTMEGMDR